MFILANSLGRFVMLRCCECGENLFVETDKFKEITEDYVILKDNIKISCKKCGVSQPNDERFIPLEPQIIRNLPTCPTCGSHNVTKISTGKKIVGFAAVGVFSSNFNKTMECKNCHYKW